MNVWMWAGLVFAGALGAVARFGVDRAITRSVNVRFPLGILVVNVSGALVLGVVVGLALDREATMIVGTGLVGSYTTFSTWMRQTQGLLVDRRAVGAIVNITVSLALGIAAAWLGTWIGGQL